MFSLEWAARNELRWRQFPFGSKWKESCSLFNRAAFSEISGREGSRIDRGDDKALSVGITFWWASWIEQEAFRDMIVGNFSRRVG
jgi:hypothetical protein